MTVVVILPVVVLVLGLVIFLAAQPTQPKLLRIGEVMFFVGLLATLLVLPGHESGLNLR
jgi:hypothetical protein